jgi:hypothetical protein
VLPAPLKNRFVALSDDMSGDLRVYDFGRTMMSRSPGWRSRAVGLRINDLPDWKYGQWVAAAYREVARTGEPLVEMVTATIQWPELGMLPHSYWRLILPSKARHLPTRLLGITLDCPPPVGTHKVA